MYLTAILVYNTDTLMAGDGGLCRFNASLVI